MNFYNMDCMEGMKQYPDKYFDLAIVDPPYGLGTSNQKVSNSKKHKAMQKEYKLFNDSKPPNKEYFNELFRVSKNQIIWGANHFISKIPYDSSCWVVWDKVNYGNKFADCELAWTSFPYSIKLFTFQWNGMMQGDMKNKEFRIHPTQKPVRLYEWLLEKFAKPGDIILDTHVGSASSLIACRNLNFDFVGFEIDKDYYAAAKERLEQELAQVNIYDLIGGRKAWTPMKNSTICETQRTR